MHLLLHDILLWLPQSTEYSGSDTTDLKGLVLKGEIASTWLFLSWDAHSWNSASMLQGTQATQRGHMKLFWPIAIAEALPANQH